MSIGIVFETHSTSEDNEKGTATGWLPGRLSAEGRERAAALGARRRHDGVDAVFASDLRRAVETAEIAFGDSNIPVLLDWRLRECDYGSLNGAERELVHGDRLAYLDTPYPHGESWREATCRVKQFLDDLPLRWDDKRIVVIGHVATRLALEHYLQRTPLETVLVAEFNWQPGWEYLLSCDD